MIRILLHSQEADLQSQMALALGREFEVFFERRMDGIRDLLSRGQCDVLMLDLDSSSYPIQHQLDFLDEIQAFGVPIVVMTEGGDRMIPMELVQRGVYNYLSKPASLPELKIVVRRAHEFAVLKHEVERARPRLLPTSCDQLVGSSVRSKAVYELIRRVAYLESSVLITGESGTGKELIARAIHNLGHRKEGPFVAVSCGAIPDTLMEAELFGSEKGAYTGAAARRKGYIEEAGHGTLFFDEIGEFSPLTQVKLLRVIQEKQFSRLGSSQLHPLRARLLFATHRNLLDMVEKGTFRKDLYYRINVMGIRSPGLREHSEDIPHLAQHFLEIYAPLYHKSLTKIAPGAMSLLLQYEWPGNIRELENVIQGAIIISDDDRIDTLDLPDAIQHPDCHGVDSSSATSFDEQMRHHKIKLAYAAIVECKGNKTLAARSLNISRTYLHRLIREPGDQDDALPIEAIG